MGNFKFLEYKSFVMTVSESLVNLASETVSQVAASSLVGQTAPPIEDYGITGPEAFFGIAGVAFAVIFANIGSAYGTMKSSVGICSVGINQPHQILRSIVPVIMAGILGVYGLIVGVI